MTSRKSSGSSRAESSVEPTRSQNMTVSCRRSAASTGGAATLAADPGATPPSAAMASSSLRRWPTNVTPRSFRSPAVRRGSTLASIAFSRKAASYCSSPRPRSHAATSTLASPTRSPPSFILAQTAAAGEYSGAVCRSATPPSHSAAIAVVIDLSVREDLRSLRRAETPLGAALATSTQGRHVPLRRAWCTGSQTPHIRPDIVRAANDGSGYELSPRPDPNNDRKTSTAVVGEGSQRSTIGTKQTIETACGSSAHWGEADADASWQMQGSRPERSIGVWLGLASRRTPPTHSWLVGANRSRGLVPREGLAPR